MGKLKIYLHLLKILVNYARGFWNKLLISF